MKSFNLKFYTLPSSSCHAEISTYKVGIRNVSRVRFPWFSDKMGSPNSTSCLSHTVIAKHTHLSLLVHTYTRTYTHTLTFLVVQHTTNKLNIFKIAKQPVKWNGSSCSRLQTFSSWPKLFSFALRDYGFDFFVLFFDETHCDYKYKICFYFACGIYNSSKPRFNFVMHETINLLII